MIFYVDYQLFNASYPILWDTLFPKDLHLKENTTIFAIQNKYRSVEQLVARRAQGIDY